MDIFKLTRNLWDFSFANKGKIKPHHVAIYLYAVEQCNRLGWKDQFGFPTSVAMEAVGISSYSVFKKYFDDLIEYGFLIIYQRSKNQHTANVIGISENYKEPGDAHGKALDRALITNSHNEECFERKLQSNSQSNSQSTLQSDDENPGCFERKLQSTSQSTMQSTSQSTSQSTVCIDIQEYNTTKQQEYNEREINSFDVPLEILESLMQECENENPVVETPRQVPEPPRCVVDESAKEIYDLPLDDCFEKLDGDQAWLEVVSMQHRTGSVDRTRQILKDFRLKLLGDGETVKSPRDAKKHFNSWLRLNPVKAASGEAYEDFYEAQKERVMKKLLQET